MPHGGPFDCYPPGYPGYSYPYAPQTVADPHGWSPFGGPRCPSVAEQMGADPISKLAAAIERLADALLADETAYLLRSPRNAKHLLDGIRELNEGRGVERELKA